MALLRGTVTGYTFVAKDTVIITPYTEVHIRLHTS